MTDNPHDFFFKKITLSEQDNTLQIKADDLRNACQSVTKDFVTAQFNRFLCKNGSQLSVTDLSSAPAFKQFLNLLELSQVGKVEIYIKPNQSDYVRTTLNCDLYLADGIVRFKTQWSAHKPSVCEELVSTMLVPLHLNGLHRRTLIRHSEGTTVPLVKKSDPSAGTELRALFELAEHPLALSTTEDERKRFATCVEYISNSTAAFERSSVSTK